MSKIPTRPYCTACKKLSHGEHCKRGDCSCKCRYMNEEQIKVLLLGRQDDEFSYSKESDDAFERLMKSFRH